MFGLIKKSVFREINNFIKCKFVECISIEAAPLTVTPLRCIAMNNQECKVRPKFV